MTEQEQKTLNLGAPALSKAQHELFSRAVAVIRGLGVEAIFRFPDGSKMETEGWHKRARPATGRKEVHKKGELRDYVMPHIVGMKPGESRLVPIGPYTYEAIQPAVTSYGQHLYGTGTVISTRRRDKEAVEILYTAGI